MATMTVTRQMDERTAAQIAIEGGIVGNLQVAARALYELLRNPDDTYQVFLLGVSANARAFPNLLARFIVAEGGIDLLKEKPSIDSRTVDFGALRALPADTLGGAYARYLDENKLDPDLFQAPPGLPPVIAYLAQRMRQTHDVWHVLTGYKPDVPGELALQAFTFGQTRMPSSWLIATMGTIRFGLGRPRMFADAIRGYRRGSAATFLPTVRFEEMWEKKVEDVRRELGIAA